MDLKEAQTKAKLKCGTCNSPIESENGDSNCACKTREEQGRDLSAIPANRAGDAPSNSSAGTITTDEQKTSSQFTEAEFGDDLKIVGVIGVGGMGTVYKVHDEILQKDFAIKKLRPELALDKANVLRFTNEIEAAKQFTHTNLVSVYRHGVSKDGSPYFLMDCIEGQSLADMLKGGSKLEIKRAIDIFIQICDALAHAHMKGIIHRDLKPSNVLITQSLSGVDSVKIVDFGVSKLFPNAEFRETQDLTRTGDVLGTPLYMSPEQCLGFKTDERSDIYSLGCLMYEALTGTPPFKGENPVQIIAQHLNELPQVFTIRQDPEIVKALETVIFKAIEKSPEARYRSMDEVRIELEKLKEGKRPNYFSAFKRQKNRSPGAIGLEIVASTVAFLICNSFVDGDPFALPQMVEEPRTSMYFDYVNAVAIAKDLSEAHRYLREFSSGKDSVEARYYSSNVSSASSRLEELVRVINGHPELKNSDTETFVNLCHAEVEDLRGRWKEASSSVANDKSTSLDQHLYSNERKLDELASKIHDHQANNWRLVLPKKTNDESSQITSNDYAFPLHVTLFLLWITLLVNRLGALKEAWFEEHYQRRRETERFSANKQNNWWRG